VARKRAEIAGRDERQAFWSEIMRDKNVSTRDRLRASELLGKSGGDFVVHLEHSQTTPIQLTLNLGGADIDPKELGW
jgi:phage terminase small subunit